MSVENGTPRSEFGIVYRSPQMAEVMAQIRIAARGGASVLILGESGTGKELVAQMIHALSPYSEGPFLPVNLSALSETLWESELFGHVKGAFTGAFEDRIGYFLSAHGGCLFLDEIGDAPVPVQVKLLRVLDTRKLMRVGSSRSVSFDSKFICATNRNPAGQVETGRLREDFLHRIATFIIWVPPLRERTGDVPVLLEHFMAEFAAKAGLSLPPTVSYDAFRALCTCKWPGNVRELRNVTERLVSVHGEDGEIGLPEVTRALTSGSFGRPRYFGALVEEKSLDNGSTPSATNRAVDLVQPERRERYQWTGTSAEEKAILETALSETKGIVSQAALMLGIGRSTFHSKIREHRIDVDRFRNGVDK